MDTEGDHVIYGSNEVKLGTSGDASVVSLQGDGTTSIYSVSNVDISASNVSFHSLNDTAAIFVDTMGTNNLYGSNEVKLGTSGDASVVSLQGDGTTSIYSVSNVDIISSNVAIGSLNSTSVISMDTEGDHVIYGSNEVKLGTSGDASVVSLQGDGTTSIYSVSNVDISASNITLETFGNSIVLNSSGINEVRITNTNILEVGNVLTINDTTTQLQYEQDQDTFINLASSNIVLDGYTKIKGGVIGIYNIEDSNVSTPSWSINALTSSGSNNLLFQSKSNTQVEFQDNFTTSILNFTGKHRCRYNFGEEPLDNETKQSLIGRIVSATGKYMDFHMSSSPSIDEAIPVVKLSTNPMDTTAIGVIANFEEDEADTMGNSNHRRTYKVGHLCFSHLKMEDDDRVIINGHGEGAIWVCNINGPLKNGDLITSSMVHGYGMKQQDRIIYSYTVGKITCDCDFDLSSTTYRCETFEYAGEIYKRAFVGCIYQF